MASRANHGALSVKSGLMPDARASRRRPSRLTPRRARPFLERRRGRPPRLSVRVVVTHASGCRSSFHIVLFSYYCPCFESSPTSHSHPPRPRRRAASRPSAFKKFIAKVGHFTTLSSRTRAPAGSASRGPSTATRWMRLDNHRGTPPFVTPHAKHSTGSNPRPPRLGEIIELLHVRGPRSTM